MFNILTPPLPGTTTPVTVNLDGRKLRAILNAHPSTPILPDHQANDLAEQGQNGAPDLYRRVFSLHPNSFPEHADIVYVDIRDLPAEGEPGAWQMGAVNLGPDDGTWSIVTADGTRTEVRYRAVNPNAEVVGESYTIG